MRVLHILDHSLPLHSGYTFRTRAIMVAQIAQGWQVAGITGPRQGLSSGAIETVEGLTFYRTAPAAQLPSPFGEIAEVSAFARRIEAIARVFQPDILHAHSPVLNAMAAGRAAKKLGLPLVYEIRAFWEDAAVGNGTGREGSIKYRVTRALETRAARRADKVAVICEGLRGDLVSRGIDPAKIFVSPNGVDMGLFGDPAPRDAALATKLGLGDAEVIGFIGSFYDYEGLDDLIAAMPALVAAWPKAHLLLVGGGPKADDLARQAAASPVANRIHFLGRVPHAEVERYYGLIDVLAYPRKRMRLTDLVTPLKPLEAMAQGRLVAASDVGGHRELMEDGVTGTLFPADDPAGIAKALAGLLADRSGWDRRRATARAYVAGQRDWAKNVARYNPVYQELAHRP
jgi:PEP-CTERM/exosortase A-associated glycosyltransferase